MVKIQEVKYKNVQGKEITRFVLSIPKTIADLKGIKKGDEVNFKLEGDKICLEFEKKNG